jgi:predicted hydrolase (HD superfamily)
MVSCPSRDDALELLHEYTKTDSLRRHALGVEQAMRKMADKYYGDPDEWGLAGLMHDFDYEKYPSMEEHPFRGNKILEKKGYPSPAPSWGMRLIVEFHGIQIWPKHFLLWMN